MSTISVTGSRLSTESRSSRTWPALVMSISTGSEITAARSSQSTGKRSWGTRRHLPDGEERRAASLDPEDTAEPRAAAAGSIIPAGPAGHKPGAAARTYHHRVHE